MIARAISVIVLTLVSFTAHADVTQRTGWIILPTNKSYSELVKSTKSSIKVNGLIVVTQAGPTKAAKKRGIEIPGNLVIGAFNNDYAVRVLNLSTAAMIEAPIRFYVTENADNTATLSYKMPSFVFAPYLDEGGQPLREISSELDAVFESIANAATE